jgi:hypothetical protein
MVSLEPADFFGQGVYLPERTQTFSNDQCFLCGVILTDATRSDEHVVAKWLLQEFDLWNVTISLVNQTTIPYRQLTIPCCTTCNTTHLADLEKDMQAAYRGGQAGIQALGYDRLLLWLLKVSYGLFFRELFLPFDRRQPERGPALDREFLSRFAVHHALLQAVRGIVRWREQPATIIVYPTQTSPTLARANFDYSDNALGPFLGVRMGAIGIIAVLQDWGAIAEVYPKKLYVDAANVGPLAPLQFRELIAFGMYVAANLVQERKLFIAADQGVTVVSPVPLPKGAKLIEPFNGEHYAHALARSLDVPIDRVWLPGEVYPTFLRDDEGKPTQLSFDAGYE